MPDVLCLKPLSLVAEGEEAWTASPSTGLQIRKNRRLVGMVQFF
jgi:hypothetical protein